MYRTNQDPRQIKARFYSTCKETGAVIKKGDQCIYYPSDRAIYSLDSRQAEDFRNWKMDLAMGNDY